MDPDELPDLEEPHRKVLAICGGGYAGVFAAEFLARLEARLGGSQPLGSRFDLISGASIGGLLALGLAKGVRAAELPQMLTDLGPSLFSGRGPGLFRPKHKAAPLREKLDAVFGSMRLSELDRQVLIPSVNLTGGEALVFGNGPNDPTRATPAAEAALATSAAPWFLPPHAGDRRLYADGGLIANSPEAIAAVDAVHRRGWSRDRTVMLVVGSTQVSARLPGHLIHGGWGLVDWARDLRLLTSTMRAQMSLARQLAQSVLGVDNVHVADVELNAREQKSIGLDKATPAATANLQTLAREQFEHFCRESPVLLERW